MGGKGEWAGTWSQGTRGHASSRWWTAVGRSQAAWVGVPALTLAVYMKWSKWFASLPPVSVGMITSTSFSFLRLGGVSKALVGNKLDALNVMRRTLVGLAALRCLERSCWNIGSPEPHGDEMSGEQQVSDPVSFLPSLLSLYHISFSHKFLQPEPSTCKAAQNTGPSALPRPI